MERTDFGGTAEPWLTIDGKQCSRAECFAAYTKAEAGEPLTQDEARMVGGWLVHPLNTTIGLAPFGIATLLLRRQGATLPAPAEPPTPEGWIQRWKDADTERRMALDSLRLSQSINEEACEILRAFVKGFALDPPVGVAGQAYLAAKRFLEGATLPAPTPRGEK